MSVLITLGERWDGEAVPKDLARRRDVAAIRDIADSLGIAPSIVLGRVQEETGDHGWGHALRRGVDL